MPVYKSKLKSIGNSSGVDVSTYYADNSPYTGYVILSKSLPLDASYGLFNDENITKEYLSRGDANGLINSNYAVDLSTIYKTSIGQAGESSSVDHLACAALGKNIGNDNNYFYYYMDIDDSDNNSEVGFPFNDNDGGNSIITPFSDSKFSNTLYANFAVVGMSKAATPYINAGLFLEDCNRETLSDVKDLNYNGKNQFGGNTGVYEFPGSSALSTMFAEILWYGATNAWDASVSQSNLINPVLNNNASINSILDDTIDKIVNEIINKLNPTATQNQSSTRGVYLANMANTIKNLAITNGDVNEFYGMWLRDSYISDTTTTIKQTTYNKLNSSNVNYKPGSLCTYEIIFVANNDYNTYTTYFAVYDKLYAANNSITCAQSEFGRYLYEYYRDFNEPIVLDHNTNNSVNTYKVDPTSNILNPDTNVYYYVVARPTGPFLKLDLGIPASAVEKITGRHTSYLTRYEAIGLKSEEFYSANFGASSTTVAHPLMTKDYRLDSSLVSVIGDNFSTSSKITFNDTKAEKNGKVYVSSITLHFRGNTTNFINNIKISSIDNTIEKVFALNDTEYLCSGADTSITSYKIPLQSFESVAYIGLDTSSNNAPTKLGMTCDICGSQQMVRYNSGYRCKSYIEHLIDASAGVDSQWTLLKLSGVFKIQMSGRNTYSTTINNNTDIILEAVDIEINDESSIEVGIKYIEHENVTINCNSSTSYPHIVNLYNGKSQVVMREDSDYTSYNAKCVFFNSLCGAKRMNNNIYYNDASILFNDWSSDANNRKISVYANSSNNPVIAIGGYGNELDPSIYAGAAYSNAIVSNAHFDSCNDPIVTNTDLIKDPLQTGPNTYKIITGDTSINDLNIVFSTSNTLRFSIPKPGVKLLLDYKSVEFNGSSAWTFTRSMPLNAASAANPHILIYKIEAWVETEDEHGNLVIDESASAAISISSINGNNKHKVFSGRTHYTVEDGSIYGVDYAIQNKEVLNNLYLKYNDNETNIYNAVSTSLPIKLLEPALLPLGEKNENIKISDFYGGNALKYDIVSSTYINDDEENIRRMYSAIKSRISNDIQVCLCSCAGSEQDKDDGVSMTADGKKVIYFGIGFYNNSDLIMPITASFGIDLTFTDESTGESVTYPNRISLNEFFPKDSILYMAGRNYKNSMNSVENTKIRFVKTSDLSNDSGLQKYNREGTLKNNDIQIGEIVNIGGGIQEDNAYHNEGEIHASSIETSGNKVISLYGIFNIYSGEVNYISTGSTDIINAGLPDVLYSSIIEADPTTGAYSNYVKFMNEIAGKCLTESQHICKFIHCTEINNVPYII